MGTLALAIPRVRDGSYFPSLLEPRGHAERALLAVVQEAYVLGVSTRRVEDLGARHRLVVQERGEPHVQRLDAEVEALRSRSPRRPRWRPNQSPCRHPMAVFGGLPHSDSVIPAHSCDPSQSASAILISTIPADRPRMPECPCMPLRRGVILSRCFADGAFPPRRGARGRARYTPAPILLSLRAEGFRGPAR